MESQQCGDFLDVVSATQEQFLSTCQPHFSRKFLWRQTQQAMKMPMQCWIAHTKGSRDKTYPLSHCHALVSLRNKPPNADFGGWCVMAGAKQNLRQYGHRKSCHLARRTQRFA